MICNKWQAGSRFSAGEDGSRAELLPQPLVYACRPEGEGGDGSSFCEAADEGSLGAVQE